MTQPFDDEHGDRLRRALHAEAEAVTPSAEGLERIRSKIDQRHERRFGFLSVPWSRPLAAVTAAIFVCVVAVSVTPALANFVQTGRFSPDAGSSDGNSATTDGNSHGQVLPSGSSTPIPNVSPSPTAIHPSNTGKHVVSGGCRADEEMVTSTDSPAPGDAPTPGTTPKVTCRPTGASPSSVPTTEAPPPPPVTSPPVIAPSDDPTTESAPVPNPYQSP
jgi:hypothetical protein